MEKLTSECESAKILINEGLIEEAKKLLFRLLAHHPQYAPAKAILNQIEELELKSIYASSSPGGASSKPPRPVLDESAEVAEKLLSDLDLTSTDTAAEKFNSVNGLTAQEFLDLAIAYTEMDCFADALRELKKSERLIRMQESFLGQTGLAVVALTARCLMNLGRAFEAKAYLEPVLVEFDLNHESKIVLFYEMGLIEENLGNKKQAHDWFIKVINIDPQFKDTQYRISILKTKP